MFVDFYEACIMQYKIISSNVRLFRGNCYHMLHFSTVLFGKQVLITELIGRQIWLDFIFAMFKDVGREG